MRLSKAERARFAATYGERNFEPTKGRRMREYVRLPEELLTDTRTRSVWIRRSLNCAESIKPQGARKKKAASR